MPSRELLVPREGLAHVPPALFGEVFEAPVETGGQALRRKKRYAHRTGDCAPVQLLNLRGNWQGSYNPCESRISISCSV